MQQNEIPFLSLFRTGFLNGLAYAAIFGLPLYCCCILWFGVVFPPQNFAIDPLLFATFVSFLLAGLGLLFWGYWRLGARMAEKAGTILAGVTTSGWMAIIVLAILWVASSVSSALGGPIVRHPGNAVRAVILFGGFYLLTPLSVLVGGVVFGGIGGEAAVKKAGKQREIS